MKKGKILIVGLIALLMVVGLVLASCGACPKAGGCTVSNNGSGNTCSESNCAARKYMLDSNRGPTPASCDCS